jgi:hypothetical protein
MPANDFSEVDRAVPFVAANGYRLRERQHAAGLNIATFRPD